MRQGCHLCYGPIGGRKWVVPVLGYAAMACFYWFVRGWVGRLSEPLVKSLVSGPCVRYILHGSSLIGQRSADVADMSVGPEGFFDRLLMFEKILQFSYHHWWKVQAIYACELATIVDFTLQRCARLVVSLSEKLMMCCVLICSRGLRWQVLG